MSKPSSRDRLEQALIKINDPAGEGARACLTIYADNARQAANAADARAKAGQPLGPLDGVIVSIKDLFDVKGEVTRAGSRVLANEGLVAAADAPVVRRLRAAGAVILAKTNMSEFAFSGIGANPHYGTPGIPADRTRVPGGSSAGAAVAVADGMCEIGIGTDTGGSTRIPAAFCGIVGYKPSKFRIPTDGAFPLSYTLDSVGPLAHRRRLRHCGCGDGRRRTLDTRTGITFRLAVGNSTGPTARRTGPNRECAVFRRDRRIGPFRSLSFRRAAGPSRRYGAAQCQGHNPGDRRLCDPSRAARDTRRGLRPQCARPPGGCARHFRLRLHRDHP